MSRRRWLLTVFLLATPAVALARVSLTSGGGFLFDIAEASDSASGSLSNGSIDAYDTCYRLRIDAAEYSPTGATVTTLAGRQVELPAASMSGLDVSRIIYVPASGGDFARYLEVLDNPSAADITVTLEVYGNLGSDSGTVTTGTSSGDSTVDTSDIWFATDDSSDGGGDPSLAHVFSDVSPSISPSVVSRTSDNISYQWSVTVPAMGRAVIMHFAVQTTNRAASLALAADLVEPSDLALMGADDLLGDVVNFDVGFETAPCVGLADGEACVDSDAEDGVCRDSRCCTGCFDGTRCVSGRVTGRCGAGGGACVTCVDGDLCTDDICTGVACENPDAAMGTLCDDDLFCTRTDLCDGAGTCVGSGAQCDDNETCTIDSCDEGADACTNRPRRDGRSCTTFAGSEGLCWSAQCCAGCFNGVFCVGGAHPVSCGVGGELCTDCTDGDLCTSDVCTAGLCSNPNAPPGVRCDDGLFCTAVDVCDGSGVCSGTGSACDDGRSCTTDLCDEGSGACMNTRSEGCLIGGACVASGAVNPTYPCQVCDPARNETDWSMRPEGAVCGSATCAAGRLSMRACDTVGACALRRSDCPTGHCEDAVSCETTCTSDGCGAGERCDTVTGHCEPLRAAGTACSEGLQCGSGACVDGVCCTATCAGVCERCNLDGTEGTCTPIAAGQDPDNECDGATWCDGEGACTSDRSDGGLPDAGVADGGVTDAGRPRADGGSRLDAGAGGDAGDAPPEAGGCACRASGSRGGLRWAALLALLLPLWLRARRR